jgi:hypothetical protein
MEAKTSPVEVKSIFVHLIGGAYFLKAETFITQPISYYCCRRVR